MRRAVIVLGMHRSGTSAVAGAAICLGLAPPRTPMAPTPDNPTGFHEPLSLTALNELFLKALGCTWHDCLSFDPDTIDDAARATALEGCTAILRKEFGDEPAFVVKDPRLCLTLPIWLPAFRALGAAMSVLLVVRHPDEVVKSVFWRDMLPESDTAAVWLHHLLEAERATRGIARAVVSYANLLHDWRGCMARAGRLANIGWPTPDRLFRPNIGGVVIPSLQHHIAASGHVSAGSPLLCDLANEAWLAVRQMEDNPSAESEHDRLDYVRSRFAAWRTSRVKSKKSERDNLFPRPRPF
jgi:hypothetical protein